MSSISEQQKIANLYRQQAELKRKDPKKTVFKNTTRKRGPAAEAVKDGE